MSALFTRTLSLAQLRLATLQAYKKAIKDPRTDEGMYCAERNNVSVLMSRMGFLALLKKTIYYDIINSRAYL
jgi:hypothetical protein